MLEQRARLASIDMLRGVAILWVLLFHLWGDIKMFPLPPVDYYSAFVHRAAAGELARLPTSFIDAISRVGYQGVPLFMMLSGLSLYLSQAARPLRTSYASFFVARFRRILLPYWFGFALVVASAAAIALVQAVIHDTSFVHEYHHGVTLAVAIPVDVGWNEAFGSITLVSRTLRDDRLYSPNGSLWFAVLILQYYVLFVVTRPVLDRVGPAWFVAGALALTLAAKLALIAWVGTLADTPALRLNTTLAPFRFFEFALGMGLAYVITHRAKWLDEYVSAPLDIASILLLGLLLQIGGSTFDARTHYLAALSQPMTVLGLTLLALPLIAKTEGRFEAALPSRAIAWVGVMSYPVLITNEPLRLVASSLRVEDVSDAWWWFYLTAVYLPVTLAAAWPVAWLLGFLPSRSTASAGSRARADDPRATTSLAAQGHE